MAELKQSRLRKPVIKRPKKIIKKHHKKDRLIHLGGLFLFPASKPHPCMKPHNCGE